jgi:chromosome segregation ATPase
MGIIRKTLSVTTLGVVGWKSKKELLAETESDLAAARADLAETSAVRAALQERLESVEHKLKGSELHALHDAKSARRDERRRMRKGQAEAKAAKARKQAEARAEEARARLQKTSKSARKAAERARSRAEHLAGDARHQVDEVASTVRKKVRS